MARCGTGVIVDEVFVGGGRSQQRLRAALSGSDVLWVGVHCSGQVAAARERGRPDRIPGMAESQAEVVHPAWTTTSPSIPPGARPGSVPM